MSRRIACTLALVLSMIAMLLPGVARVSAQVDPREGVYVDPTYGWGVMWDPDSYEAEEIATNDGDVYGVSLSAQGVFAQLWSGDFTSTRNCLNTLTDSLESDDGVSNFEEAGDLDPLETDPDARAGIYRYDFEDAEGDQSSWVRYYECREIEVDGEPVDDVTLTVSIDFAETEYETVVADFEQTLASIEYDAAGATGSSTGDNGSTGSSGEAGLGDGVYVDEEFGWAVSWDPDTYEAEAIVSDDDVPYGVNLAGPGIFAEFFGGTYTSPRNCLNTLTDNLEAIDGVTNFEEADDLELLETDPEARAGLFRYDFENAEGEESSWVRYFECREIQVDGEPVEETFLVISIDFAETAYDTVVDDFEPILESIAFDVTGSDPDTGRNQGNSGDDDLRPGLNGNVYLDETYGYSVTWDETVFTGEEWGPDDSGEVQGVQLATETGAFMTFFVQEASSVRSCVNGRADAISGGAFDNFEEIEAELPETGEDARQAIWQGIFTTSDGDELDIILYSECTQLIVDGEEVVDQFLAVDLIATPAEYEDLLPAVSETLLTLTFDAASAGSNSGDDPAEEDPGEDDSGEDPADDPDDDPQEGSASGIDGDTYTSALGYSISWDGSTYAAELIDEDEPDLGVSISSQNTFMLVQVAGDATLEACVEAEADIVADLSGISDFGTSRLEGPETPSRSESGTFGATLTFENGDETPVFIYIQCTELGEVEGATLAVIIRIISIEETYEDELPLMQEIVDSLEITGPPSPEETGVDQCDPSYPDFCIPANQPDIECDDLDEGSFEVRPPDPYNFDEDGDGIGCEPPPN